MARVKSMLSIQWSRQIGWHVECIGRDLRAGRRPPSADKDLSRR